MTARAGAGNVAVIETGTEPGRRGMTDVTFRGGNDMRRMLACSSYAVVAAGTGCGDAAMIERCITPADSTMTDITLFAGDDMCRVHARGDATVMT